MACSDVAGLKALLEKELYAKALTKDPNSVAGLKKSEHRDTITTQVALSFKL